MRKNFLWQAVVSVASPDNSPEKGMWMQPGETEFKPDRKARGSGGNMILRFEPGDTLAIALSELQLYF